MTIFRRFVRGGALILAGIASAFTGVPRESFNAPGVTNQRSSDSSDRAPASAVQTAGNLSLGMIDAPDFRTSYRRHIPIWVGRPRSPHGRQYGPRV